MGAIIGMLRSVIFGLPGSTLTALAARLTTSLGTKVAATAGGVFNAVKGYIGNNPGKAAFIFSIFSQLGISYAVDVVQQELGKYGDEAFGGSAARDALLAVIAKERTALTGDGKADSLHGMDAKATEHYLSSIRQSRIVNEVINDASRMVGGIDRLEAIRAAIFLEDTDFKVFREMKGLGPSNYNL